eukprot:SAG25_NODE_474_length_7638_cov_5.842962_3_plen_98_part_00
MPGSLQRVLSPRPSRRKPIHRAYWVFRQPVAGRRMSGTQGDDALGGLQSREGTAVSGQLMGKLWRALDDTGKAIYKEQAVRSIPPCCCVRVLPACAT